MRLTNRAATALRMAPDVAWGVTHRGVAAYTNTAAMLFEGPDARAIAERTFPLLDGTRSAAELCVALPDLAVSDIASLLRVLRRHGVLARARQRPAAVAEYLTRRLRLHSARVLVCAEQPWSGLIPAALYASGVGRVDRTARLSEAGAAHIAIGVFEASGPAALREFAAAARAASLCSLAALVDNREALIGPLTAPGRSPCWNCGGLRMRANA